MKFSIKDQFIADLVTFAEEILNEKLHFLCSVDMTVTAFNAIFLTVNLLSMRRLNLLLHLKKASFILPVGKRKIFFFQLNNLFVIGDTFFSNCLVLYSSHLYVDVAIMFSGLSRGLGSAGCVFKLVWQFVAQKCCRNLLSVRNSFSQQLYLTFSSISLACFPTNIFNLYLYFVLLLF